MGEYVVNRPDEAALRRVLARNPENAAGAIIRLAWCAGLGRDEIVRLSWGQINLLDGVIRLESREIPMPPELRQWLRELRVRRPGGGDAVVLSDRDARPLTPQSVSRLARLALDEEGLTRVRLIDLRHDFILRQLAEHDWQYVSRVSGDAAAALKIHFGGETPQKKVSTRVRRGRGSIDEFRLWKLLQDEQGSPAGVALWLTWQLGLRLEEVTTLRWEQVDLREGRLCLPDRTLRLTAALARLLGALREKEPEAEFVVLAPRSRRPYDPARLSRLTRTALVRAGLDDVTLRDLRLDRDIRVGGETQITACVKKRRSITCREAARLLGVSESTAYTRLKKMTSRNTLTQIGSRYYLPDTVVPPERQREVILDYLAREGFAYRQDIARLLNIDPRQCGPILRRLLAEGVIVQEKQKYRPSGS